MKMQTSSEERLQAAFRRAAAMPWYRDLLAERGTRDGDIRDTDSFSRLCPVLTKQNTFDRFSLDELACAVKMSELASVLTSSGHGGRFSFGLGTRKQASESGAFIDYALDDAFQVKSRPTLAINCLPMGVGFSSECMTVATTSVREDMAVALVNSFGRHYDQVLLVADPLFAKRLTDYAFEKAVDWSAHRIHVALGEETFGEHFREYLAGCLALSIDDPGGGYIMSSFGVGELGLHLAYETPATIALRRAAWKSPEFARDALGSVTPGAALPAILAFNPLRTYIEIENPDVSGFGNLTVSMLDLELPIPLLRYQTGDAARLLDGGTVHDAMQRHGISVPGPLPEHFFALQGRIKEALPNGSHVAVYKDALYAEPAVARRLTGAFRAAATEITEGTESAVGGMILHVQLAVGVREDPASLEPALMAAIPKEARPSRVVLWLYEQFPFGMSLDYERKFAYYVPQTQP